MPDTKYTNVSKITLCDWDAYVESPLVENHTYLKNRKHPDWRLLANQAARF